MTRHGHPAAARPDTFPPGLFAAVLATVLMTVYPPRADGQPSAHHVRLPIPVSLPPPPPITLVSAEGASARDARDALARRSPAVGRCLTTARTADPVSLARIRSLEVTVHLGPSGEADAVELDPPGLPHGLSACLGSAFLSWRQGGHAAPRAALHLRVQLRGVPRGSR